MNKLGLIEPIKLADDIGFLIETASIPKMLILFLGFALIIAIMYLFYKIAKNGIEKNNEKFEKIKNWTFDIMILLSFFTPFPIYLFQRDYDVLDLLGIFVIILKIVLRGLLGIKALNKKVKVGIKIILLLILSGSILPYVSMLLSKLWWEYPSHMIYTDTATLLSNLFFLFISIFVFAKTKKSLTTMKVIMILSVLLLLSNAGFYFGYEIFHKVSKRVVI